jgi:hypothetical protein
MRFILTCTDNEHSKHRSKQTTYTALFTASKGRGRGAWFRIGLLRLGLLGGRRFLIWLWFLPLRGGGSFGFILRLWLLFCRWFWIGRCRLVFGSRFLGFRSGLLLLTSRRSASQLQTYQILPNGNGILLVGKKLFDGPRFRRIDCYINLGKVSRPARCKRGGCRRTLSVSIVAISSSCSTKSPICFDHCFRVPSEIDSAISGTLTIFSA